MDRGAQLRYRRGTVVSEGALDKEELHFLGRLLAFLEVQDIPEGLLPNITISVDYKLEPSYGVWTEDGETWILQPLKED